MYIKNNVVNILYKKYIFVIYSVNINLL